MAGFGGLGGLGGSSYPQRFGSPNSEQIKTPDEYQKEQQAWIDQMMGKASRVADRDLYREAGGSAYSNFLGDYGNGKGVSEVNAKYLGLAPIDNRDAWVNAGSSMKVANPTGGNFNLSNWIEPEFAAAQQRQAADMAAIQKQIDERTATFNTDMAQRGENQTRQQQSYDSMNGWGQLNGVMGPNYTDPNFGQISGQAGGPLTAPTMPNGVDPSWTSGVFDPSGGLTGVYGANNSTKKQGFL